MNYAPNLAWMLLPEAEYHTMFTCSSQRGSDQLGPFSPAHVCAPPTGRYHFSLGQTSKARKTTRIQKFTQKTVISILNDRIGSVLMPWSNNI